MSKARQQANLSSDGNLFADISNDRVGVGSIVPTHKLHVNGTSKFDDDVKFEGTTAAKNIIWDKSADSLLVTDSTHIKFGTGADLSIYHNGSHSYIDNGTGSLYLRHGGTNYAKFESGGSGYARFYQNGNARLETTSTGAKVTGNLEVTGVMTYDDVTSVDSIGIVTARAGVHIDDSIVHIGDTNTKIRFPAADTITAETNGNERLRITSAGKIGIGEAAPTNMLHVKAGDTGVSSFDSRYHITVENNGESYLAFYNPNNSFAGIRFHDTTGIEGYIDYYYNTDEMHYLSSAIHKWTTNGSERLRITSGGTVNIGGDYTNTTGKLKVTGVVTVDGGFNLTAGTFTAPNGFSISSGNVTIPGDIFHDGDSNTYFGFGAGADTFHVATNGSERFRLESTGSAHFWTGNNDYTNPDIGGSTTGVSIGKNVSGQIYACVDDSGGLYYKDWVMNLSRRNNAGDGPQLVLDRSGWAKAGIAGLSGSNTANSGAGQFAIYTFDHSSGSHVQTERLRIASDGKIGIGTIAPATALHAYGGSTGFRLEREGSNPGYYNIAISHGTPVGANNYGSVYFTLSQSTGDYVWKSSSNERMRLTSAGNVGIGNNAPSELLSLRHATSNTVLDLECLAANDGTTGNIIKFRGKGANGVSYHASQIKGITKNGANNAGFLSFWTNSAGTVAERLRITSAGALNIGKGDEAGAVENLVELYVGGNDTSHATIRGKYNRTNEYNRSEVRFGVENNSAGKGFLAFATGNNSASERLRITSAGNVGINRGAPAFPLDIQNNGNGTTALNIRNTAGTNIFQLYESSNGDGNHGMLYMYDGSGNNDIKLSCNGYSWFNGGSLIIGNTAPTFSSPAPSLTIEKNDNGTGPLFQMYNAASGQLNATCEIRIHQNYRDANRIIFGRENNNNWQAGSSGTHSYTGFWTNYAGSIAERLRIDSAGRVLVGDYSDTAPDGFSSKIQVNAADHTGSITIGRHTSNSNGPLLIFHKSRSGSSTPNNTALAHHDLLGGIRFFGADGTDRNSAAAEIRCEVDGGVTNNDMPGRLTFKTTKDGASSPEDRAKIDSKGTFTVFRSDVFTNHLWSTVNEGCNTNHDYGLHRHVGYISAGASTATINLLRARRHYWGMGHYKFTLKQNYYHSTPEARWYLNGHGRNTGMSPNWNMTHYNDNSSQTTIGSSTLQCTAASNSSPGNDYATYTDVYATVSAYNHFVVIIEAYGGSAFSTDITSIANDGYALH